MEEQIKEFTELMNNVDITQMDMVDQATIIMAFGNLIKTAKPILLKYAMKDPNAASFIVKL